MLIVQRNVYAPAPPAGVKTALEALVLLNCASDKDGPEIIDQAPVPTMGAFAARLAGVVVQRSWFGPAAAAVGGSLTVI